MRATTLKIGADTGGGETTNTHATRIFSTAYPNIQRKAH